MASYFYFGLGGVAFLVWVASFWSCLRLSDKAAESMIVGLIGWMSAIFVGDLIIRAWK